MGPNPGRGVSGSMRKLHVVGYAADQGGFVLSARKGARSGSYFLALDDALLEEIERAGSEDDSADAPQPVPVPRSAVSSALTPREIQARLRAGQTIEEVASDAGVDVEWVDRFAAPVLAEQAAAVERAGRAVLHTPRKGPSDRPLDASVRRNLAERGVAMSEEDFDRGWSARHLLDTDWLITFRFRHRGRAMTAEWLLNATNGSLTTRNRLGADLGFLEPGRELTATAVADAAEAAAGAATGPTGAGRRRPSGRAPAKRSAVAKRAVAAKRPAVAKRAVAAKRPAVAKRPAGAKRAVAAKSAVGAKRPAVGKAPGVKAPAKRAAVGKATARSSVTGKAPADRPVVGTGAAKVPAKRAAAGRAPAEGAAAAKAVKPPAGKVPANRQPNGLGREPAKATIPRPANSGAVRPVNGGPAQSVDADAARPVNKDAARPVNAVEPAAPSGRTAPPRQSGAGNVPIPVAGGSDAPPPVGAHFARRSSHAAGAASTGRSQPVAAALTPRPAAPSPTPRPAPTSRPRPAPVAPADRGLPAGGRTPTPPAIATAPKGSTAAVNAASAGELVGRPPSARRIAAGEPVAPDASALRRADRPLRADRPQRPTDPTQPVRVVPGRLDEGPDTGGVRFGNPD